MKKLLAILFSVLFFLPAAKGQNGEVYGTVTDEKGTPFQNVSISVFQNKKLLLSTFSEEDGSYSLKPMPVGCFKVEFKAEHYIKTTILDLPISSGGIVKLKCKMNEGSSDSESSKVFKMPLVKCYLPSPSTIITPPWHESAPLGWLGDLKRLQRPKIKPSYIYLTWSEQFKYNFNPRPNALKQINKSYTENDLKYIPFQHFLETLPAFQR